MEPSGLWSPINGGITLEGPLLGREGPRVAGYMALLSQGPGAEIHDEVCTSGRR